MADVEVSYIAQLYICYFFVSFISTDIDIEIPPKTWEFYVKTSSNIAE